MHDVNELIFLPVYDALSIYMHISGGGHGRYGFDQSCYSISRGDRYCRNCWDDANHNYRYICLLALNRTMHRSIGGGCIGCCIFVSCVHPHAHRSNHGDTRFRDKHQEVSQVRHRQQIWQTQLLRSRRCLVPQMRRCRRHKLQSYVG